MEARILVLSLDYDDCLVRTSHGQLDAIDDKEFDKIVNQYILPKNMKKWKSYLKGGNIQLINFIKKIETSYTEIILCCGSNRQDPYLDITNSCRSYQYSGSCYEALFEFKNILANIVNIPVSLDCTLTADIFNNRKLTATFNQMLTSIKKNKKLVNDFIKPSPSDRTKVSLHYFFMHKISMEKPGAAIDYIAIDDSFQGFVHDINPSIIDALNNVYSNNTIHIPHNTKFITLPYQKGIPLTDKMNTIPGTGKIDPQYDKTMIEMMVISMPYKNYESKKNHLYALNSCSCWDVFKSKTKKAMFISYLENLNLIAIKPAIKFPDSETKANDTTENKTICHASAMFPSKYMGLELEARQYISEITQVTRHKDEYINVENYFNNLSKLEQDELILSYQKNKLNHFSKNDKQKNVRV